MAEIAMCIPVWNRRDSIIESIDSLACQGDDFDIHVFDNASSDGTVEAVKERFGTRAVIHCSEENIGYVGNINRCLKLHKRYEWIGILHSDDVHTSRSISTFRRYKDRFPRSGIIFSKTHIIGDSGECIQKEDSNEHIWQAGNDAVRRCQHQIPCSATFYNARAIREHGLFSLSFPYSADEEYNSRLATTFDVVQMNSVVASYRHHGGHLMYSTWGKEDFIRSFEAMRVKMDSYLKDEARGAAAVKKDIAIMLARQTLALLGHGNHNRVIANRFFANLWEKAPLMFFQPGMLARLLVCNFPVFSSRLCRLISRSI